MKPDYKKKKISGYLVDDTCIFCGLHSDYAGGHAFVGYLNEEYNIETIKPKGWLIIEHTRGCYIQICPKCLEKIKKGGIRI